jgi:hypothetical protein
VEIVFVHLGERLPNHLVENFLSFKVRFPSLDVKLLVSAECKVPKGFDTGCVYFDDSHHRDHVFANLDHDLSFRNQFWRKSLERILALCEYQTNHSESSVLHFESDILVLPNFPFVDFEKIETISWQNYNDERDVASILYIPNKSSSKWLYNELVDQISGNGAITDMSALREIRRRYPSMCHIIPTLTSKPELANNESYVLKDSKTVNRHLTEGIYDSAQIGMWLTGMDPRNTYGVLHIHSRMILETGEAPLDPSKINYSLNEDGFLDAILGNEHSLPIFSLHVHSKRIKLFKSSYTADLMEFVKLGNARKEKVYRFEPSVLFKLFSTSVVSGNILNFFLGIPHIYRLRLRIRYLLSRN